LEAARAGRGERVGRKEGGRGGGRKERKRWQPFRQEWEGEEGDKTEKGADFFLNVNVISFKC
jgi:hypothetical protein